MLFFYILGFTDIKFYFIKEKVAGDLITIEYTSIGNMLTDPLTKGLSIFVFQEHVSKMRLLVA